MDCKADMSRIAGFEVRRPGGNKARSQIAVRGPRETVFCTFHGGFIATSHGRSFDKLLGWFVLAVGLAAVQNQRFNSIEEDTP